MIGRVALGALGVALAAFGGWTLLANQRFDQLFSAALWLGGGVALHDFLLAPLTLAIGWALWRVVPTWARGAVAAGGIILGTVTVVAIPVLGAWGRRPDNASLLPRDYWTGWLIVALTVVAGSAAAALMARRKLSNAR